MVQLRRFLANKLDFNKILDYYPSDVVYVKPDDIYSYFCGTYVKGISTKKIYTDNEQYIILPEILLNGLFDNIKGCTEFKQVVVRLDITMEHVTRDYTGSWCYSQLLKILKKVYTTDEIEEILHSYDNIEYNDGLKQFHYNFDQFEINPDVIYELSCCTKYDINGAHEYALIEMFPKAKDLLLKQEELKQKAKKSGDKETVRRIKSIFNYCVGFLKRKGYVGAYNFIVQKTTTTLFNAIEEVDGELLYANTDGFLVKDEKHRLPTSTKLGEFKLEHEGNVYLYIDKNYFMFEYNNGKVEQVGSNLQEVRPYIKLSEGQVAHYDRVRIKIGEVNNKAIYTQEARNIVTETKVIKRR